MAAAPSDVPVYSRNVTTQAYAISAGEGHSCALTAGGGVKCWGWNAYGQLGDGTTTDRLLPTDVLGLASGVRAISAGGDHTCALTTSGAVKCWGYNGAGELGDGTTSDSSTPKEVSGLSTGVVAISGGYLHTCALMITGGVKCWGNNPYGTLGDGTTANSPNPVDVSGLTKGVAEISAGATHTCALLSSGRVKCWGSNAHGELGDGTAVTATPRRLMRSSPPCLTGP